MKDSRTVIPQESAGVKSRNAVLNEVRTQLGPDTPQTRWLIDAWDTADLLTQVFSAQVAQAYLQAGFEAVEGINDDNE